MKSVLIVTGETCNALYVRIFCILLSMQLAVTCGQILQRLLPVKTGNLIWRVTGYRGSVALNCYPRARYPGLYRNPTCDCFLAYRMNFIDCYRKI